MDSPLNFHDFLKVPEYFQDYCPQFRYHLMDLSIYSDDEIRKELIRLVLFVMKNIDSTKINELFSERLFPLVLNLLESKKGIEYIEDMLYYIFNKSSYLDEEKTIKRIGQIPKFEPIKEYLMTLAEKWEQRGNKKGFEKGFEKGEIHLVSKQLRIKFREKADMWIDKLPELSSDELDIIAERILTANSLPEVFKGFSE
ncbi:MAG: Rpn family recombination-promoting nuclease/putative transposase [Proteobacteria bacterium]|nr:Rpn family recombination-promoting nuclease/putative transposase [Pseudomonadota bacterium]